MSRSFNILFFGVAISFVFLLSSCTKKTCPAYHSVFILHEEDQHAYFSPFGEDSIPKTHSWGKKANGISQGTTPKNYKKRHYNIPMKDYYGEPDNTEGSDTEWEFETNATDPDGQIRPNSDSDTENRSGVE